MIIELLIWWALIEILSIISLPIAFRIFTNINDFGYCASKLLGIAMFSYITFMLSFAIGFTWISAFASFSILFLLSLAIFIRDRRSIISKLKKNKDIIIKIEIIFLLLFLIFTSIRAGNPDINSLEKFMDFSFLNSISSNSNMPPMDPWLSGGNLNYYYFGHFITAALTKLSGLGTNITYNLMLAMMYAIFSILSFSIAFNLTKKFRYGILAIIIVVILGNAFGFIQLTMFAFPSSAPAISGNMALDYPVNCCWNPYSGFDSNVASWSLWPNTRIIPDTINEFPMATFLFGDLHAHFFGFAFHAMLLLLLLNIMREKKTRLSSFSVIATILILGMSSVVNFWDFVIYALFFGAVLLSKLGINNSLKIFIPSIILSILLFAPFYISLHQPGSHFNIVQNRSGFFQLLVIYAIPVFVSYSYIISNSERIGKMQLIAIIALSAALSYVFNIYSLLLFLPALLFSLMALKNSRKASSNDDNFFLVMIAVAMLVLLMTDIAVIDIYENSRFNAVFKIFLPIWTILGISSVYMISRLRKSAAFYAVLAFLIFAGILAPFFVSMNFLDSSSKTLDGTLYMKSSNPGDYYAIQWLNENHNHGDVILESPGRAYTYDSRISANTGIPTIIGWVNHEFSWRGIWFTDRENDANQIYNTQDNNVAMAIIGKYNVTYVYVGSVEKEKQDSQGLDKFDTYKNNYILVYDSNGVKIYVVNYS